MRKSRGTPISPNRRRAFVGRIEGLEGRRLLAMITVNTAVDSTNPNTTLSLRQAIEVSNATLSVGSLTSTQQLLVNGAVGATNTIDFTIPTSDPGYNPMTGVWTIVPASELPTIATNAALIDGYSQTGASQNSAALSDNAVLKVAVDGAVLGNSPGLVIDSTNSEVMGLDIENFAYKGVEITGQGIQVSGCFIGTDSTGKTAAPNAVGVSLEGSDNTIGGTTLTDRNIISGNNAAGEGEGIIIASSTGEPIRQQFHRSQLHRHRCHGAGCAGQRHGGRARRWYEHQLRNQCARIGQPDLRQRFGRDQGGGKHLGPRELHRHELEW